MKSLSIGGEAGTLVALVAAAVEERAAGAAGVTGAGGFADTTGLGIGAAGAGAAVLGLGGGTAAAARALVQSARLCAGPAVPAGGAGVAVGTARAEAAGLDARCSVVRWLAAASLAAADDSEP